MQEERPKTTMTDEEREKQREADKHAAWLQRRIEAARQREREVFEQLTSDEDLGTDKATVEANQGVEAAEQLQREIEQLDDNRAVSKEKDRLLLVQRRAIAGLIAERVAEAVSASRLEPIDRRLHVFGFGDCSLDVRLELALHAWARVRFAFETFDELLSALDLTPPADPAKLPDDPK
jgi:hypothetical protein